MCHGSTVSQQRVTSESTLALVGACHLPICVLQEFHAVGVLANVY